MLLLNSIGRISLDEEFRHSFWKRFCYISSNKFLHFIQALASARLEKTPLPVFLL